ncbi:unnamed protein product, partial [Symbiodinium pilosum]
VAVLTGHIVCGCVVGAAASTGVRKGYEWVTSRHRYSDQAEEAASTKPEAPAETQETSPSSKDVLGPLHPLEPASMADVAESTGVQGPLGVM